MTEGGLLNCAFTCNCFRNCFKCISKHIESSSSVKTSLALCIDLYLTKRTEGIAQLKPYTVENKSGNVLSVFVYSNHFLNGCYTARRDFLNVRV